jgi:hypothetical protein
MTRQEADRQVKELADTHPDRDRYAWFPRQGSDGSWSVVRVPLPAGVRRVPTKETVEAKPKPPQADDPRPPAFRDIGGPYAVG